MVAGVTVKSLKRDGQRRIYTHFVCKNTNMFESRTYSSAIRMQKEIYQYEYLEYSFAYWNCALTIVTESSHLSGWPQRGMLSIHNANKMRHFVFPPQPICSQLIDIFETSSYPPSSVPFCYWTIPVSCSAWGRLSALSPQPSTLTHHSSWSPFVGGFDCDQIIKCAQIVLTQIS